MRTYSPKAGEADRKWHVIDAQDVVLGRLATHAAVLLRGKHKATFAPHMDMGDFVIVINADKVRLTGRKMDEKVYVRHTGYPGGQRISTPKLLKAKSSSILVEKAVRGMLPKTRLGSQLYRNLFVYNGPEHPHAAQQPKELKF